MAAKGDSNDGGEAWQQTVALLTGDSPFPAPGEVQWGVHEHRGVEVNPIHAKGRRERERSGVDGAGQELARAPVMARWWKTADSAYTLDDDDCEQAQSVEHDEAELWMNRIGKRCGDGGARCRRTSGGAAAVAAPLHYW
jgi:hypothetical protein